jgi:hypothetical protein
MHDKIQYDPSKFLRSESLISSLASCTGATSTSFSLSSSSESSLSLSSKNDSEYSL